MQGTKRFIRSGTPLDGIFLMRAGCGRASEESFSYHDIYPMDIFGK